jgi:hypothetical protein
VNGIALSRVPGLREAIAKAKAKQSRMRENAWKKIPQDFFGLKLRIMTVQDYLVLDHYESPFLYRLVPEMCDLAFFCWSLSPACAKWNDSRWQLGRGLSAYLYSRKVVKLFAQDKPEWKAGDVCFQAAVVKSFEYIDDMFLDAPASIKDGHESGVCYIASWFDMIQSNSRMSDAEVLSMPLPQLFQRIKAIQQRVNEKASPSFNRIEDEVKAWVQKGISEKRFTYDDLAKGKVTFGEN